jgi:hypothetical protein
VSGTPRTHSDAPSFSKNLRVLSWLSEKLCFALGIIFLVVDFMREFRACAMSDNPSLTMFAQKDFIRQL